jgi:hypothetical protein
MKLHTLAVLAVAATPVFAQQEPKFFYTRQECAPAAEMVATTIEYGEQPLFASTGMTFSMDGVPFTGGAMFFVNQDTGTWTLLTLYADGTACMTAVGTDFEPYSQ